jgi:hypothetical protein
MTERPRPNRSRLIALILLALVLIGAGAWWTWGRDAGPETDSSADPEPLVDSSREDALEAKQARRRDAAPLERVIVGGRVTRKADGAGVRGATILLARKGLVQGQAPTPGQPTIPLTATTDASGDWRLVDVEPGRYLLSATAAGFLPATRTDLRLVSGIDQLALDLVVEPGGQRLSGHVTDIGGGPIEGVLIQVTDTTDIDLGFGRAPLAAMTDEDGRYALQVAKGRYALTTWHTDYVGAARQTELHEGPREEDFELVPGGTIEGVVLARPEGEPVAGALVTFADSRSGGGGNAGGFTTNIASDGARVISDEQGRFVIRGVRSGVVTLSARAPGHASATPIEVPLGIGEQVGGVELWVEPAFTLAGFVVPRGDPEGAIEGVLVGAWQMSPPTLIVAIAPTGDDGYFEIQGVRAGAWQVGALDEDHLMVLTGASATVKDQDVRDLILELDEGLRIRGRVDPPQPAKISVQMDPGSISLGNMVAGIMDTFAGDHTDERGEFEVGPVAGGGTFGTRKLKLTAFADSGDRGEIEVEIGRDDLADIVIPLTPRATVAGTVLDDRGAPQTHVSVEIRPVERAPGSGNFSMNLGGDADSPTSEEGGFAVRGLDLGKHQVVVEDGKGRALDWAEGLNPDGIDQPLAIDITDTVNTQFLALRVVPRDGVITGAVLDGEGLPVADAWVTASLDEGAQTLRRASSTSAKPRPEERVGVVPDEPKESSSLDWSRSSWFAEPPVLTDENGFFTIQDLRRGGTYQVVAEGERGGARAVARAVAPGSRITLTLESLTTIAGRVIRQGKPVERYTLKLRGPVQREQQVYDAAGEFRVERLDPGAYTVSVKTDEGHGEAEVEVESGAKANVTIEIEGWAVLTGELVVAASGEPMVGIAVHAIADSGDMDPEVGLGFLLGKGPKTDKQGKFRIDKVASGKGSVGFLDSGASLAGGGEVAEVAYDVEAGETLDLGTIQGLPTSDVPVEERGTLQLGTRVATFAQRPRPPGTELEQPAEPADEDADEGPLRLWVFSVEVGGVADLAGLEPGDEILTIDGQSVASLGASTAQTLLSRSRLRVGQSVRLESERDDERSDITLEAIAVAP